jgi:ABC-type glycerol-3-phosphate transport system permease component
VQVTLTSKMGRSPDWDGSLRSITTQDDARRARTSGPTASDESRPSRAVPALSACRSGPIPYHLGVTSEKNAKNSVRSKGYSVSSKGYGVSSKRYEGQRKWPSVLTAVGAVVLTVIVAALAGYTIMRDTPAPISVPRVSATSG